MSEFYIKKLKKMFSHATVGQLTIYTPEGKLLSFEGEYSGPICDVFIKNWKVISMVFKRADIGLGEAYHEGFWSSSNVTNFLIYCELNFKHLQKYITLSYIKKIKFYLYNYYIRANTKKGAKKNILAHYDLGNDFYAMWLDPSMTYSSALRQNKSDTLEQAQKNKYQRMINNLYLKNKTVLEIGCGWGGFAEQAAQAGADVTGITISRNQYNFSKNRLGDKANIVFQDYRDIKNKFDNIVSIEMFEAVGEKYWPVYFDKIKSLLTKNGRALIQTITIRDDLFECHKKDSDYIRHHIFPGGLVPSKQRFIEEVKKAKMKTENIIEFGEDYAWTLKSWLKNFQAIKPQLVNQNYPSSFLRSWEFYLHFCIAAFELKKTNVMQIEIFNYS